ncbi:MAG TPA: PaaI family thioesterase [Vineibacter sp.]|nr:PaaI family thioesterase [Vineibacter sp.]
MSKSAAAFQAEQAGSLPGLLGFEWIDAHDGVVRGRVTVGRQHLAPTGYLHAATIVALADTACGFGCLAALPADASGFTTAELKANFIGTVRTGGITCEAQLIHGGRTTQVWDATVKDESTGKTIALFRCTQVVLYPT